MEEEAGGGLQTAAEGPQIMRRRKYNLMPQSYKDELVRASHEDATAWDDARFKAAWQKLAPAEQKRLIEDAASSAKAAAGKPSSKRRRECGEGPIKSAKTGASSGKSIIGEAASSSPAGGQWSLEESNDDDDAILLAALEMAEQQLASRMGHSGKSIGAAHDAQHQAVLDGVHIARRSGDENANVADAGANGVENTLPDSRHLARIHELEAQFEEARKQASATVSDTTLTSKVKQEDDEKKKTEEKLAKEREKQEKERQREEKARKEKADKEEKERLKKEQAEKERAEKERIKHEKAEKDKAEKEEQKRLKKETEEKDKQEKERIKMEKETAKQRAQEEKESRYLSKIQELEAQLAEARTQAATTASGPRQADVDSSALPRITADTSVAALKAEAKARGQTRGLSSLGKGKLLEMLSVGSILLSQTCEFRRYQQVLCLMDSEENAHRAARRAAEQKLEQQRQAERARQAAEEKQREQERVAALHTHKSTVHPCPLARTIELPNPNPRGGWLHNCTWGDVRANVATCQFCHERENGRLERNVHLPVCIWSCTKCDFDVCADCYEIEALPEAQRAAKRVELGQQRERQKEEERKRAAAEELKRVQLQRERKERQERQIEAKVGKFQPQHKKRPPENRKPLKKGFIVYNTEGDPYDKGGLEFDSSWATAADANARAKYLFYFKNCWGLSVEEMLGESGYHEPPEVEMKSGMVQLYSVDGTGAYWKVAVVPCAAFEHLPGAQVPGQRQRDLGF